MNTQRYLQSVVEQDLAKKMVFIGGPRQVGKTTLAQQVGKNLFGEQTSYLNWDFKPSRENILKYSFPAESKLLIFDELHKYRLWKGYMKGLYDVHHEQWKFLVTGSARLDIYRRGGDSLLGRYQYYRLHPFSVHELLGATPNPIPFQALSFSTDLTAASAAFTDLLQFGGFPEPLFAKNSATLARWHSSRSELLVKEDIRDLEGIRDLSLLQVLVDMLPHKVGSLLSTNALREDLGVAHQTVAQWLEVLERFYYHFRLMPFASSAIKSLRKQPKLYLWDWSEIADEGARLENMVASHLLKFVHFLQDTQGHKAELMFLRDIDERETDFIVTIDKKPWFIVEVKSRVEPASTPLLYFQKKLQPAFVFQLTREAGVDTIDRHGVRTMSAATFLSGLV